MLRFKEFQFPEKILDTLAECSNGFLLFVIDDKGNVVPSVSFENESAARTLVTYAEDFAQAFRQANIQNMLQMMAEQQENDSDESEEF